MRAPPACARGNRQTVADDDGGRNGNAHATLSKGAIAGIVCGAFLVVLLIALGVYCYCACRHRRRTRAAAAAARERQWRAPQSPPREPLGREQDDDRRRAREEDGGVIDHSGAVGGGDDGCRLCHDLEAGEAASFALDCGHRFHLHCVRRWLRVNSSCPLCNSMQITMLGLGDIQVAGESRRPTRQHRVSTSEIPDDPVSRDDGTSVVRSSFRL